jgi:hypothetical protein
MQRLIYRTKKITFYILYLLFFTNCGNGGGQKNNIATEADTTKVTKEEKTKIQYTDQQLESYLDSIGNLPTYQLTSKVSFVADSTFKNQLQIDKLISVSDFAKLKQAIKQEKIDSKTAINIFGKIQVDSSYLEEDNIPVTLISFDKNKNDFNEYAICLGYPDMRWSCELYFFKQNKILALHRIEHHYGLEIEHYKDNDGKTIIYYKENFGTGTGIWQFNFYFYKYYDDKLIPILNILENGNLQMPWGARIFWFEAFVTKTTPLTLKMVYYQELYDTTEMGYRIIDDSTFVQYSWEEKSRTLVGNYDNAKINMPQILTYFLEENELLFINAYYQTLKDCLQDKVKRKLTLDYLNQIKNHYENN